jgi:hypothetical protein
MYERMYHEVHQRRELSAEQEKREHIWIKHLNNPQNFNLEEKVYLTKYRRILDKIIIDLY